MTDPNDLLPAILENPADDLARLVYADALDDRGGEGDAERAEYIRLTVGFAQAGVSRELVCPPGCPCRGQGRRADDLISKWRDVWYPPMPGESGVSVTWWRGFPDKAEAPLAVLIGGACGCGWGCSTCSGTGHRPGQLPAILSRWPITTVATDRMPRMYAVTDLFAGPRNVYGWAELHKAEEADGGRLADHLLPYSVFCRLKSGVMDSYNGRYRKTYSATSAAAAALSAALIAWAKAQPAVSPQAAR